MPQFVVLMESVLTRAVFVTLDGQETTAVTSASLVSSVTAVIRPARALTAPPVTLSTDAARVLRVSTATAVKTCVLWGFSARPAPNSVAVMTFVHVTLRQEAVTRQ